MRRDVQLRPEPQAASKARAWIREELTVMGRPELIDSAQLATSELVTNAVLHAGTRITLAVSDDADDIDDDEILIEVADASTGRLVQVVPHGALTTVGNGLHIIGALARRWGVHDRGTDGKTVWFVPASPGEEARAATRFPPDILVGVVLDGVDAVGVELLDVPVRLLWECRFRVRDLRREMALLTLEPGSAPGVPQRLVRLAEEIDSVDTAVLRSDGDFEHAVARADKSVSLRYVVARRVGPACAQLADLLDEVDVYCRQAHMLTLAAPPAEYRLRRWFLYEFARQAEGRAPLPWRNPGSGEEG